MLLSDISIRRPASAGLAFPPGMVPTQNRWDQVNPKPARSRLPVVPAPDNMRQVALRGLTKALFVLGAGYAGLYLGDRYGRSPRESMLVMLSGLALGVGFWDTFELLVHGEYGGAMRARAEDGGAILEGLLNRERNIFRGTTAQDDELYRRYEEHLGLNYGPSTNRNEMAKKLTCEAMVDPSRRAECQAFFADTARVTAAQARFLAPPMIVQANKIRTERE